MEYVTAKREILTKRVVGTAVLALSAIFVLAGLLLFLHGSLDGGGRALANLSLAL